MSHSLISEFKIFHSKNPHVYDLFKRFTMDVIGTGRSNYSARTILHRIRWHTDIDTQSVDRFKINNNHSAFYGRLFMDEFPQHAGFFRLRAAVADRVYDRVERTFLGEVSDGV